MDRSDLPDEILAQLRSDVAALGEFLRQLKGKDPQGQLIVEFIDRWRCYPLAFRREAAFELLSGLLNEAREVGATLRIELWSEQVAPLDTGFHDLIEEAFNEEVCAYYQEKCSGNGSPPWLSNFLPPVPAGGKHRQWGEKLFSACLDIYAGALKRRGEDALLKSWLHLRRSQLHQRYLPLFCAYFELKEPRSRIDDRYTIDAIAGIGGMGVVYIAQEGNWRRVALKMPRPDCKDWPGFAAEVANTIKPTGPGFLTILHFNVERYPEPPYYTMLYVDGGQSLADIVDELDEEGHDLVRTLSHQMEFTGRALARSGMLDAVGKRLYAWRKSLSGKARLRKGLSWCWRMLRQTARTLKKRRGRRRAHSPLSERFIAALLADAADTIHRLHTFNHGIGLVHRDIKPGNLLLSQNSGLLVSDLGLGLIMDASGQTEVKTAAGTPGYYSPEQALGGPLTPRCDIYALGAVLYRAMTGREPVPGIYGELVATHRQRTITARIPPPGELRIQVSSRLEHIRCKAMEWEKAKRYATAKELADDLRRFVAGRMVMADPGFTWKNFCQRTMRSPWFRAGAFAALLASAGGYAYWRNEEQIPGISATANKYVLRRPIARPTILPVFGSDREYPNYESLGVSIDDSSIYMDLRDATQKRDTGPVEIAANPSKEKLAQIEVNPTYYTRVITLHKSFDDGRPCLVPFQFRTGGNEVYLKCLSHPATLYGNPVREPFGKSTIVYRVLLVDITKETRTQFPIVIQGTIWDGFRETPGTAEKTQWAAFLSPVRQNGQIAMRFPKGKRPPTPPATNFQEKSKAAADSIPMPADRTGNRQITRPLGKDYWIWRVSDPERNKYYIMKFLWSPFTPLPDNWPAIERPD